MRTIVDIPEDQIKALDSLGKKEDVSRAELVRRAINRYLETETAKSAEAIDKYFGLFKGDDAVFGGMDGLEYQQKIRAEWDERDAETEKRLKSYAGLHDHAGQDYKSRDDK